MDIVGHILNHPYYHWASLVIHCGVLIANCIALRALFVLNWTVNYITFPNHSRYSGKFADWVLIKAMLWFGFIVTLVLSLSAMFQAIEAMCEVTHFCAQDRTIPYCTVSNSVN